MSTANAINADDIVFKQGRKIGGGVPLKAFEGWMHLRALDGDKLPRGKYFDKYRSNIRGAQYDQVMARVRELAGQSK